MFTRLFGRWFATPASLRWFLPALLRPLLLVLAILCVPRLSAQDPAQLMQQLTALQQQLSTTSDPCPIMPKLKAVINQIADQSPDVYKAMKPSLDLLNSEDDGCKPAPPQARSVPYGTETGTAPSANCVYLSPSQPCVPLAQYKQMQLQQQPSGPGICPASGFVPGVMLPQASDVAAGVPCKPGTPYGPLIATTANGGYTGVTPPDATTAASFSGTSGFGAAAGGATDPVLNDCIGVFYKNDPITGDHLIIQNNCSVRAQVFFYASSQVHGGVGLDPGESDNTYASHDKIAAAGGLDLCLPIRRCSKTGGRNAR